MHLSKWAEEVGPMLQRPEWCNLATKPENLRLYETHTEMNQSVKNVGQEDERPSSSCTLKTLRATLPSGSFDLDPPYLDFETSLEQTSKASNFWVPLNSGFCVLICDRLLFQ